MSNKEFLESIEMILSKNDVQILEYDGRDFDVDALCGEVISSTCDLDFLQSSYEDDEYLVLMCLKNDEIVGIFFGEIYEKDNYLESSYTCSSGKIKKIGELMRYYGFLLVNNDNASIAIMSGSASGGIPAQKPDDSPKTEKTKSENLLDYHVKRGAAVNRDDKKFSYAIDTVIDNVEQILSKTGSRKKKKKKTKKKIKR
jgi:hypothetical protein